MLEKAIGEKPAKAKRQSDGRQLRTAGTRDRIEAVLRESFEPLSRDELKAHFDGRVPLHLVLPAMVKDGRLVEIDGKYGLATTPVEAME